MASTTTENEAILNRLMGCVQYHPLTAELFSSWIPEGGDDIVASWTLDPGDIVTISDGTEYYAVPIFNTDVDWKGEAAVQIQSTGSERRPEPSALQRRSYAAGKQQQEQESEIVRNRTNIEQNSERITLWATEEEWDEITESWALTHKSQFDLTAGQISTVVTGAEAPIFNSQNSYAVGDKVWYGGSIYVFTSAHTAGTAWDPSEVRNVKDVYGSLLSHTSRITQTEDNISLVVEDGGIKRGAIILAINGDGHSDAKIEADQVVITGSNINVGDVITVATVGGSQVAQVTANSVTAQITDAGMLTFRSLYYQPSASAEVQSLSTIVTNAQLDGNTLQIWKLGDPAASPSITFSKATTLTGGWDSGVYKVEATQTNNGASTVVATHTYDPPMRLNGLGSADNFTAEITEAVGSTTTAKKSIYGYLGTSGSTTTTAVNVYTSRSGSGTSADPYVYGNSVATLSVGSLYTAGQTNANAAVTLSKAWQTGAQAGVCIVSNSANNRTAEITLAAGTESWAGTQATIPVLDGNTQVTSFSLNASSKLEALTGTSKITANGTYTPSSGMIGFSSVEVDVSGTSIPPSSHIQLESGGHYTPSYSAGGQQITSWVSTIKTAVQNSGYFYFDAWLSDNSSDKKRYYIKFS